MGNTSLSLVNILSTLGSKIGRSEAGSPRMLLREDDVQRLEFNTAGQVMMMVMIMMMTMMLRW